MSQTPGESMPTSKEVCEAIEALDRAMIHPLDKYDPTNAAHNVVMAYRRAQSASLSASPEPQGAENAMWLARSGRWIEVKMLADECAKSPGGMTMFDAIAAARSHHKGDYYEADHPKSPLPPASLPDVEAGMEQAVEAAREKDLAVYVTAIDGVLAERDRLTAAHQTLRGVLKSLEWSGATDEEAACPACGNWERQKAHRPDCRLNTLLNYPEAK